MSTFVRSRCNEFRGDTGGIANSPHWIAYGAGKIPLIPGTHAPASVDDPATWRSFDAASAGMNDYEEWKKVFEVTNALDGKAGSDYEGLGWVVTPQTGIVLIDIDDCRNSVTGDIAIWAQHILERIPSYAEVSPSGTGVHVICKGNLPAGARKRGSVEIYLDKRYFCMTGNKLPDAPATVEIVNIDWLHQLMTRDVFSFAKTLKLESLMNGDWTRYPSQSEADLAFCSLLAQLGLAETDIDNAFRLSGLFREKWDTRRGETTYGAQTIAKALEGQTAAPATPAPAGVQLIRSESGAARPLVGNAIAMLRGSPEWQGVLGFNEFTQRPQLLKPAPGFPATQYPRDWTDNDDTLTACWLQSHGVLVNSRVAAEAVQTTACENPFHPIRDYLSGLVWDGIERADLWLVAYFEAPETEFIKATSARWLISAVARIFQPGCQADYTLLLEGAQGIRKSAGLRALVGDAWFADHLSPLGSKDAFCELSGKWIIELSELSAMRRSEIETVKSFLTARIDHYRAPYAKRAQDVPRQCVFCASTNEQNPLVDASGNRRFWPVRCGAISVEALASVRDQLWAEAVTKYRQGAIWWLESKN